MFLYTNSSQISKIKCGSYLKVITILKDLHSEDKKTCIITKYRGQECSSVVEHLPCIDEALGLLPSRSTNNVMSSSILKICKPDVLGSSVIHTPVTRCLT